MLCFIIVKENLYVFFLLGSNTIRNQLVIIFFTFIVERIMERNLVRVKIITHFVITMNNFLIFY